MTYLSIVIPVYNEEENLRYLYDQLMQSISSLESYEIIFVDDGSVDRSIEIIRSIRDADKNVRYIAFSRNFGHQAALRAGIHKATGSAVIMMDADMQHPPTLIPKLVELWKQGFQIVNTVRSSKRLPFLKRCTSMLFYKLMNLISDIPLEPNAADFRLLDRKVVEMLKRLSESGFFLRGLTSWVGFRQTAVPYEASDRYKGTTKYSWAKMFSLAWEGITSLTVFPLRLSVWVGFSFFLLAILYGVYIVCTMIWNPSYLIPGWTSVICCILFVAGFQLIMFGLIGEYISRIARDVKARPHYIIADES